MCVMRWKRALNCWSGGLGPWRWFSRSSVSNQPRFKGPHRNKDPANLMRKASPPSIILLKLQNVTLSKRWLFWRKVQFLTIMNSFLLTTKIFQLLGTDSLLLLNFPDCHGFGGFVMKGTGSWPVNHQPQPQFPIPFWVKGKGKAGGKRGSEERGNRPEEMGNEAACRPAGAAAESRFPEKIKCWQPSEQLPGHGFGTNDRILLHLSQQALVPKNMLFANEVLFQIPWALAPLSARPNIWPSTWTVWRMERFQQLLVSKSSPPLTFHPASETASCIR